jgi:hypothetical protein
VFSHTCFSFKDDVQLDLQGSSTADSKDAKTSADEKHVATGSTKTSKEINDHMSLYEPIKTSQ